MLSLKPVNVMNPIWYVGESHHTKHRLIHVFGISALLTCKHTGTNVIAFPIAGSGIPNSDQIIEIGGNILLEVMLKAADSSVPDSAKCDPLNCVITIFPDSSAMSETLQIVEGIPAFASTVGEFYPGYQIVTIRFEPFEKPHHLEILMWYKPARVDALFVPTVNGTCGEIDFNAEVYCDDWIFMSSMYLEKGIHLSYPNTDIYSRQYLPKNVIARHITGWYKNAETISSVEGIRAGMPDFIHRRPFWGVEHG